MLIDSSFIIRLSLNHHYRQREVLLLCPGLSHRTILASIQACIFQDVHIEIMQLCYSQ